MSRHRIDKTVEEKERELRDAFSRLQRATASFDEGNIFETGAIALNVYALVHDASKRQPSALTVVGRKAGLNFVDTAAFIPGNLSSEMPMTMMELAAGGFRYLPTLDKGTPDLYSQPDQPFTRWWNNPVIKAQGGSTYSRKNLIFHFRHERGGHVGGSYASRDGQPAADFVALARENVGGWVYSDGTSEYLPEFGPEYATVRQIGWEVEQTLLNNFADLLMPPKPASRMAMRRIK